MKLLFFFILSLFSFKAFSDAGNAYRFYVEVNLKNGEKFTGYIYHQTYNEFNKYNDVLISFLKENNREKIVLHPYITSVNLGTLVIDFSRTIHKKNINLDKVDTIKTIEIFEFNVGDRIFELSEKEFNLIKIVPPYFKIIHKDEIAENCSYILISWKEENVINIEEEKISRKLNTLISSLNFKNDLIHPYIKIKKEYLINNSILLVNYCDAL